MVENWHHAFDPQAFLRGIDVERFLEHNDAYAESRIDRLSRPCVMCGGSAAPGLLLNDGSCLCRLCFEKVSLIQYPEKYEALKRQYVADRQARILARQALIDGSVARRLANGIVVLCICSAGLMLLSLAYVVVPCVLALAMWRLRVAHRRRVTAWDSIYRLPAKPVLRHFHDPAAELTPRDAAILHVFDHWPGFPPYWTYLRQVVLQRDSNRCQVSGCPSRLQLHVHHMVPRADGGTHAPHNLVTLCDFHHALEPEKGHERVWSDVRSRFFTLVCQHERSNRVSEGFHLVRAHLRRLQLVTQQELNAIAAHYGLSCPMCGAHSIRISVDVERNVIEATCPRCAKSIEGPQQLAEESGPRLAEVLKVVRNSGRWKTRWDVLADRKSGAWGDWKAARISRHQSPPAVEKVSAEGPPLCPLCGSRMYLIRPRPQDSWRPFWGCTRYHVSGCKGKVQC